MIIPAQYRLFASAVTFLVMAASISGGILAYKTATWRAQAACAKAAEVTQARIDDLVRINNEMKSAIAEANHATDIAEAKTQASLAAQEQARRHAEDLAIFSQSRMEKLEASFKSATDCGEVLSRYWELRR